MFKAYSETILQLTKKITTTSYSNKIIHTYTKYKHDYKNHHLIQ